jgi:hypothetical protein
VEFRPIFGPVIPRYVAQSIHGISFRTHTCTVNVSPFSVHVSFTTFYLAFGRQTFRISVGSLTSLRFSTGCTFYRVCGGKRKQLLRELCRIESRHRLMTGTQFFFCNSVFFIAFCLTFISGFLSAANYWLIQSAVVLRRTMNLPLCWSVHISGTALRPGTPGTPSTKFPFVLILGLS